MRTYALHSQTTIPRPIEEVFDFFADAGNLDRLTPEWLRFRIVTPLPITMEAGTTIDYRLRLRGVPIAWRSQIALWEPPFRFVDEQVRGPYRKWHHEHLFHPHEEATVVEDRVEYAVRGGDLINRLIVAPDLDRIFEYRRKRLAEYFARPALRTVG